MPPDSRRLDSIQALRGFAACGVMVAHLGSLGTIYPAIPTLTTYHGVMGVDLFFVISGFIMAYTTTRTWGHIGPFLFSRATRIYPIWWICLFIEAPVVLTYLTGAWDEYGSYYVKSLLLFPVTTPDGVPYPALVPGWTLIYEIGFYIIFAASMLTSRRWLTGKILGALIACAALGYVLPVDWDATTFLRNHIYFEFAIGVALGRLYEVNALSKRLLLILLALSIAASLTYSLGPGARFIYYGIPAAFFVSAAVFAHQQGWKTSGIFTWLGDISYPQYLLQTILISRLTPVLSAHADIPGWLILLLVITACFAAGAAAHYLVERPLGSILRHYRTRPALPAD